MDPIANMFSQLKNATGASKKEVIVAYSKLKMSILAILKEKGYITSFEEVKADDKKYPVGILVVLKYKNKGSAEPAISDIKRVSRPGRRVYTDSKNLSKMVKADRELLVSTSNGIMSGHDARKKGLGGEVICEVK